jgi:hypothetical protein
MPLLNHKSLDSDEVNILVGFEGSEANTVTEWARRYEADFPCRVAFAINQHYPELQSGFYRNKRLVALIQEALLDIGLHTVIEDNFRLSGVVPEELLGALDVGDDYILADESMNVQGRLNVWESLGGKSLFYHDRLIMEVVTDHQRGQELVRIAEEKLRARSVATVVIKK